MKAEGLISEFAFTGNPIILRAAPDLTITDPVRGTFYVDYGQRRIYEGRLDPMLPLEVNVADIVDAVVDYIPECQSGYDPIVMLEGIDRLLLRRAYASFSWNNSETEFECFAFPGGVSRQNFRTYLRHNTDVFCSRFLNGSCNFFLTVRTSGWEIPIKETEIAPLYFICNGPGELKVVELCKNKEWTFDNLDWGVFALDIQAMRWEFFDEFDVLPSVLDIYRDGMFSCRIVVVGVDPQKESYRVKFRNSLGVFEVIDLIGVATLSQTEDSDEDVNFNRYDSSLDDYETGRLRPSTAQSVTIGANIAGALDIILLRDMLASNEVYLLDMSNQPIKAIPKCEDLSYDMRITSPKTVSINFTFTDPEKYIMSDIDSPVDHRRPRLFTKQFGKQFN